MIKPLLVASSVKVFDAARKGRGVYVVCYPASDTSPVSAYGNGIKLDAWQAHFMTAKAAEKELALAHACEPRHARFYVPAGSMPEIHYYSADEVKAAIAYRGE